MRTGKSKSFVFAANCDALIPWPNNIDEIYKEKQIYYVAHRVALSAILS